MIPAAAQSDIAGPPVLLVVDSDRSMLSQIERVVQSAGFRMIGHTSAGEALQTLRSEPADVALVDLHAPEVAGLDVVREIRRAHPQCEVILMTAHASADGALDAVKHGALDYLTRPLDLERLRQLLAGARDDAERRRTLMAAESETAHRLELRGLIGRSAVMQELFGLVRRIAPHARVALVTGEAGTGKESVARVLHALGPRRHRRFVTIDCSAVVQTLFESELFGHARTAPAGAADTSVGMFEAADGGTLFLDEIGELPPGVQARLLRVIETGEVRRVGSLQPRRVDVMIVAATSRDLRADVETGRFRSDLFHCLNNVEVRLPPLRERREDIPYLTAAFVESFAARFDKPIERVTPGAERLLMGARWTGNVRELHEVLERACTEADGRVLTERELEATMPIAPLSAITAGRQFGTLEREHIVNVLTEVRGNKRAAAERLGISRRTLYRRLERHGLMS